MDTALKYGFEILQFFKIFYMIINVNFFTGCKQKNTFFFRLFHFIIYLVYFSLLHIAERKN